MRNYPFALAWSLIVILLCLTRLSAQTPSPATRKIDTQTEAELTYLANPSPSTSQISLAQIEQYGNGNQLTFSIHGAANTLMAAQSGGDQLLFNVNGANNRIESMQGGSNPQLHTNLSGNGNDLLFNQSGAGNSLFMGIVGDANKFRVSQNGGDLVNLTGIAAHGKALDIVQGAGNNTLTGDVGTIGMNLKIEQQNGMTLTIDSNRFASVAHVTTN